MNNQTLYADSPLRLLGLILLFALGVLTTLASGGGGGGPSFGGAPGVLQIAASVYESTEGTIVNILVSRSDGSAGVASVEYATADGTAKGGADYAATNGTLTWANGVSGNRTVSIVLTDDALAEPTESFTLTLSNASGASLGANSSATVNILDNDVAELAAFGVVTGLDSATVNGIRYDTDSASVIVNGQAANVSDLRPGQIVAVEGEANLSTATGTARVIIHTATIIGPVESIDATIDRLVVLGQSVIVNSDTIFDPAIDPETYVGLSVGATARISGFRNADGDIIATRIAPDSTNSGVQLIGPVFGLDTANMLFSIDRVTVDYGGAMVIDLPLGMPAEDLLVIVRGSLVDGILVVEEIANLINPEAAPGERGHINGIVTRLAAADDFDLNGFPVTVSPSTRFVNGTIDYLQANAEITIDGAFSPGSDTAVANQITFGRPVFDRTRVVFDFENFTNISVFGLTRVWINYGPNFSVEATGNADIINDIQVTQTGDTVTFGNEKTQIMDAVVTMPVLNRVDIDADALAAVTVRDFDQMQMIVSLGGVSVLRGEELRIASLSATLFGVSLLDFGGIRPIGAADVDIDGVSQAVLNMEFGSTLTGSVNTGQGTGLSTLLYYGTNVTNNVTTDAQSTVTRLGDTRP
ncbi:MAG TPA: DUF5666 domain-containing protein [Gammaproteobacteria bacterium]